MPTISVCYALFFSPQITLYQYNTQRIYQMLFITHQTETSVSATALYFYMQKPNILQFRYFVFFCFFLIPLGRCLCLIDCQSPRVYTSPVDQYSATGPNKRYITLKTYNIKSLKIHKLKENLPRVKLCPQVILALLFRSFRLFVLYQSFNIFQLLQNRCKLDSQPHVIKFTSCLHMVGGSLRVLRLLPLLKLVAMIQLKYV